MREKTHLKVKNNKNKELKCTRNLKILEDKEKGITLIALVITIIVLLILAGVSIATLTGENGIITKAKEAEISTELSNYKEQLELYKVNKYVEDNNFIEETLTAGKENLVYNTQKEGEKGNIETIIKNISKEYYEKLEVIKGKLLINTKDRNEIKIAQSLGIEVNPYDIVDGVLLSSNGNLLLMDEQTGSLTIPDSVTVIGEGAFANVDGLKTIVIPSTVKRIEKNAFTKNTTLETVIMQEKEVDGKIEGVQYIGTDAFRECINLKNVQLPNSLELIETQAFMSCCALEKIEIPKNIKNIPTYTFNGCTKLENVILNEGLTSIKSNAFASTVIQEIQIPSTVETIENNVFYNCNNLNNIILTGNDNFVYTSGMLMTANKDNILFISSTYLSSISTFSIPEGIRTFKTTIANYSNIKKIILPSSLTNITGLVLPTNIEEIEVVSGNTRYISGNGILYDKETKEIISCYSKEKEITIEEGIKKLADYSFKQAINAEIITLPSSLEIIESQVFNTCTKVQEIKIGANVSNINSLFKYNNYSGTVSIDENNPYYIVENNILYGKNDKGEKEKLVTILYKITGKFEIIDGIKEIGDKAFHNQGSMTQVIIPNSVEKISASFNYCTGLKSIEIPSSVKEMYNSCFANSTNLREIIIHNKNLEGSPWGCIYGDKAIIWKD